MGKEDGVADFEQDAGGGPDPDAGHGGPRRLSRICNGSRAIGVPSGLLHRLDDGEKRNAVPLANHDQMLQPQSVTI